MAVTARARVSKPMEEEDAFETREKNHSNIGDALLLLRLFPSQAAVTSVEFIYLLVPVQFYRGSLRFLLSKE